MHADTVAGLKGNIYFSCYISEDFVYVLHKKFSIRLRSHLWNHFTQSDISVCETVSMETIFTFSMNLDSLLFKSVPMNVTCLGGIILCLISLNSLVFWRVRLE